MGKRQEEVWVLDDLRGTTCACDKIICVWSELHLTAWVPEPIASLTQSSARSGCLVDPHRLSKCTVPIGTRGDLSLTPLCLLLPSPPTPGSLPMYLSSLDPLIHNSDFLVCFVIFFFQQLYCWYCSFLFPVLLWIYIFIGSYQSHWDK